MSKKSTDGLRKLKTEKDAAFFNAVNHLEALGNESLRIGRQFNKVEEILFDIDREFSMATGIVNKKDLSLLFVAVGLLSAKWLIMGQFMPLDFDFSYKPQEKLTDKEGDKLADEKRKNNKKYGQLEDKKDMSEDGPRTINQILFRPVPYDALRTVPYDEQGNKVELPQSLGGGNHRAYTLGHDPILGWIFGTLNIMTRSLTYKLPTLDTFNVSEKGNCITKRSNLFIEIKAAYDSFNVENERLYAAVFKQGLHFLSDKFTATGLPKPFMSAEAYLELLKNKTFDPVAYTNDVERFKKIAATTTKNLSIITMQFTISLLINEVIKAIHLMLYDEQKDGDIVSYKVRTRKILMAANCISSTSNVLLCAGLVRATGDPLKAAKQLDIGGFIETIHRLTTDSNFIKEIKHEYIREKLYKKIYDTDFIWLYQKEDGE